MIGELTNHLWQSTLFALVAGLLAVLFRKNRANIRYALWLSASLKFLLPFSVLISVGSRLEWVITDDSLAARIATPAISYTVEQMTQPFSTVLPSADVPSQTDSLRIADWLPLILLGMWACGFASIARLRLYGWRRVRLAVRSGTPLEIPGITVRIRSCPGLLEPGVVGFLRPLLLLPVGITSLLDRRQLEAVLAHELCHIRRRDNLTAALHMIVEAIFWFHPLVWWMGSRLVDERERACDEEVLRLGNEPRVYAEGILNVCRFYRASPLVCMPGVTSSNLNKRVEEIMRNRVSEKLSFSRTMLLVVGGVTAMAAPIVIGAVQSKASRVEMPPPLATKPLQMVQQPASATPSPPIAQVAAAVRVARQTRRAEFEVAVVRLLSPGTPSPGARFGCRGVDGVIAPDRSAPPPTTIPEGRCVGEIGVLPLVALAYDVPARYVSGGSDWMREPFQLIQINAKAPDPVTRVTGAQLKEMLRSLLADRMKLEFHREKQQALEYSLRVGRDGPKLKAATGQEEPPHLVPSGLSIAIRGKSDVTAFVRFLTTIVGFPITDETALSGMHEYNLRLNMVAGQRGDAPGIRGGGVGAGTGGIRVTEFDPPISAALQEQLGLRLDRNEVMVEMLVIDRAQKPPEN
jgi:uncharacterized protein (TIGR03435 family)